MIKKKSFSTKMTELENIVEKLHLNIDLQESLKIYEKGMILAKELKQYLEQAEEKIKIISNTSQTDVLIKDLKEKK